MSLRKSEFGSHLTEEQFELLKQRAMARHSVDLTASNTVFKASEEVKKLREALHMLPVDTAIAEIDKLNLPDAEKAALRVLLK